ncbi:uncharacterized protein [Argopecten irradians]|uniref:uncharacterized protein n=1 Tax=Argopecten irradians TaxID=31199 RepID=UPI0037182741
MQMLVLTLTSMYALILLNPARRQVSAFSTARMQWAFNMTQHIQNQSHQMLIMEQLVYCGSLYLCGSIDPNGTSSYCCAHCSCDDTCKIAGNCCLDKALEEDSVDILSRKGSSCVLPQLKPFEENGLNSDYRYQMVGLCHKTFLNETVKTKCESENFLSTNVPDLLPVTSVKTNETYINRYCANCNWEQDKDLIYWQTSFKCRSNFVFPHKPRELFNFIVNEDGCNMFYLPPDNVASFTCEVDRYMYKECNVTGAWQEFNSDVDWACRHYDNVYTHIHEYYKNVFCYICNAYFLTPPYCPMQPNPPSISTDELVSFAALFNFVDNSPKIQPSQIQNTCLIEQRFDMHKNVCREITCSPPFRYSDGVCKNAFSRVASQKYEMFLRFNKSSSYYTNCDTCPRLTPLLIREYVRSHLITMGYYGHTCGLNVLSFNKNCSQERDDTGYFVLHVEFFVREFHDPMEMARNLIDTSAFRFKSSKGASTCIELQPEVIGGRFYPPDAAEYNDYVYPSDRIYTDPYSGIQMILETDYESGYCPFKPWVSQLVTTFLCPHVNISSDDYNITINNYNRLCLDTPHRCFQPEEYILPDDLPYVLVCADKYFASEPPGYKVPKEDLGKVLVSFVSSCLSVLCLIITMVTYTLFPVLRTLPGLYTMALCATLIVAHTLFTFGAGAVNIKILCEVFGIVIHLTMLASVFLMNVCSIHMFRVFNHLDRQYVLTVEEKRRHFVISLVYSYGASAVFVLGRIVYSVVTTGMLGYGIRICFINNTNALLFSFTLPVMVLVLANIVMFIMVVIKVSRLPNMSTSSSCRHQQKRFLVYVKLSSLTGVAWLFGFIAEISNQDVFVYLFIILLAGQGVFIMLSFICNKRVYNLYAAYKERSSSQTTSTDHTILSNSSKSRIPHTKETASSKVDHDLQNLHVRQTPNFESSTKL